MVFLCLLYIKYAFMFFSFFCVPQRKPAQPREFIPFDILWAALSWSSACFPVLWIYYKDTKGKIILFGGNTEPRGSGGADKNGWGRPWYYQAVLFISRFREKVKVGHSFIVLFQSWKLWQRLSAVIKPPETRFGRFSPLFAHLHHPQEEAIVSDRMSTGRGARYLWKHFI